MGDGLQWDLGFVCLVLGALADDTSVHVVSDERVHAWPPEVSSNKVEGFVSSWMSCDLRIMVCL